MKFKNGILILGLLAMITACGESAEEKAMRELEESLGNWEKEFNKEMKKAQKNIDREMEKWNREMKNYGY